jgi:hypothetical protein
MTDDIAAKPAPPARSTRNQAAIVLSARAPRGPAHRRGGRPALAHAPLGRAASRRPGGPFADGPVAVRWAARHLPRGDAAAMTPDFAAERRRDMVRQLDRVSLISRPRSNRPVDSIMAENEAEFPAAREGHAAPHARRFLIRTRGTARLGAHAGTAREVPQVRAAMTARTDRLRPVKPAGPPPPEPGAEAGMNAGHQR